MSPTAFMNPTILRNLASEVSVGALMHDASSFMVYMRSGSGRLGWFGCAASCVGQAGRHGRDGFVVPHHVWYRLVGTVGWSRWCGYGCARGNLPKLESDPTIPISTTRFRFYHSDLDKARFEPHQVKNSNKRNASSQKRISLFFGFANSRKHPDTCIYHFLPRTNL